MRIRSSFGGGLALLKSCFKLCREADQAVIVLPAGVVELECPVLHELQIVQGPPDDVACPGEACDEIPVQGLTVALCDLHARQHVVADAESSVAARAACCNQAAVL